MNRMRLIGICCLLAVCTLFSGCGKNAAGKDPRPIVAAGLPPVAFLTSCIAGDTLQVKCLLPQGRTPHDYAPGTGELRTLGRARFFFSTGMAFEKKVCRPFPQLAVVDVGKKVKRLPLSDGHHHHGKEAAHTNVHHHHHEDGGDGMDPHVWLDCGNSAKIAQEICAALSQAFPQHAALYRENLKKLEEKLAAEEKFVRTSLSPWRGRAFIVYHPAFGYYAEMAGLRQIGVELDGREVSAAQLKKVVEEAKEEKVRIIFVQPQFNPAAAQTLARAIGGEVQPLDPLAADVIANVHAMTLQLQRTFQMGIERK